MKDSMLANYKMSVALILEHLLGMQPCNKASTRVACLLAALNPHAVSMPDRHVV